MSLTSKSVKQRWALLLVPTLWTARAQSKADTNPEKDQVEVEAFKEDASHVQYVELKAGQDTVEGSLAARVKSAADKTEAIKASEKEKKPTETVPIDKEQSARIKSIETRTGGDTGKGSLAARAQSVTDKSEVAGEKIARLHMTEDDAAHIEELESKASSLDPHAKEVTEKITSSFKAAAASEEKKE